MTNIISLRSRKLADQATQKIHPFNLENLVLQPRSNKLDLNPVTTMIFISSQCLSTQKIKLKLTLNNQKILPKTQPKDSSFVFLFFTSLALHVKSMCNPTQHYQLFQCVEITRCCCQVRFQNILVKLIKFDFKPDILIGMISDVLLVFNYVDVNMLMNEVFKGGGNIFQIYT